MANNKKRISRSRRMSRRKVSRRRVSRRKVSRRRVSRRRVSRRRVSRRRVSRRRVSRRRVSRRRVSRRRVSRRRVSRKKGNLKYNFFFKDTRAKVGAHLSKAMSHNPFSNPFRNKSPSPVLRLHPEDQARFRHRGPAPIVQEPAAPPSIVQGPAAPAPIVQGPTAPPPPGTAGVFTDFYKPGHYAKTRDQIKQVKEQREKDRDKYMKMCAHWKQKKCL